uniref:Fibrinogen C-terminal domain-containing protein n=1 Tax=Seriola dumerili TaxID=41447 RepID=A0A3B4UV16_SERDU
MKSLVGYFGLILAFLFSCTGQAEVKIKTTETSPHINVFFCTYCTQIKTRSPQASSGVYAVQPPGVKKPFMVMNVAWPNSLVHSLFVEIGAYTCHGNALLIPSEDHWLGLEKVSSVTKDKTKKWTLRVDLWDHEGGTAFAEYHDFRLGDEDTAFKLHVGKYSGNTGDGIRGTYPGIDQNGRLLPVWHPAGDIGWASGLHWRTWRPPAPYSAKASRMMINVS